MTQESDLFLYLRFYHNRQSRVMDNAIDLLNAINDSSAGEPRDLGLTSATVEWNGIFLSYVSRDLMT